MARPKPLLVLFLAAFMIVAAVAGIAIANEEHPEDVGHRWVVSDLALATPNNCHEIGKRCAEWCIAFQGGTVRGTGWLCCVDESALDSPDTEGCTALR